jgi:hypothetical protein
MNSRGLGPGGSWFGHSSLSFRSLKEVLVPRVSQKMKTKEQCSQ